ncbi:MAG: hypothetical protein MHMPM18_000755 [Marteilia pararefringens]
MLVVRLWQQAAVDHQQQQQGGQEATTDDASAAATTCPINARGQQQQQHCITKSGSRMNPRQMLSTKLLVSSDLKHGAAAAAASGNLSDVDSLTNIESEGAVQIAPVVNEPGN